MKKILSICLILFLVFGGIAFGDWGATFTWDANPATDLLQYEVLHSVDGAPANSLGIVTGGTQTLNVSGGFGIGVHEFTLRTYDVSLNYVDSPPVTITLDTTSPAVTGNFTIKIHVNTP